MEARKYLETAQVKCNMYHAGVLTHGTAHTQQVLCDGDGSSSSSSAGQLLVVPHQENEPLKATACFEVSTLVWLSKS